MKQTVRLTWRTQLLSRTFWLKQLRDLLILVAIVWAISSYLQRDMLQGKAPDIAKLPISSTTQPVNDVHMDEARLIYFWGTWCPACRVTSPMVNTLASDHQVLSIAVASGSDQDISDYMLEQGYHFSVVNDDMGISEHWGANALPAIYIVNQQGDIRFVTQGVTTLWGMRIRLWLASW